ncbi:MAG: hypothetical protein H0T47_10200 [Planctomycetaceae bacterium]|nr:hypothetical protein [Planctomycetaceae bacterium]
MPFKTSIRIAIDPAWPPLALAVVAAGLLAVVWFTYRPRVAHLPLGRRRLLIGLRLAAIVLLLFALLRPELRYSETDDTDDVLVILGDASRSMSVPDAAGGVTRREALVAGLRDNAAKLEALGESFELRYFDFSDAVLESPAGLTNLKTEATGEQTAIGAVLESLMKTDGGKQLAGVIVNSDGGQRAIPPNDVDPREIARRYGELGIPIYPVPYGGAGGLAAFDLAVEELVVDPLVFERKAVPIGGKIRIAGGAGRNFTVRVLIEDRTGKRPGETGELKPAAGTDNSRTVKEIKTDANNAVVPVDLSFVPQQPGEYKVAIEVVPADGEVKTTNNRRETIINVQKGGLRVAYFASPLSEQKWIRNVNTEQKIQLDFYPVRTGELGRRDAVEATWFDPGKYDAYLIGDVPAAAFGANNLRLLAERVNDGAGLMMLGGPRSFGPGGWAATPLAGLLPVEMRAGAVAPQNALDPNFHIDRPLQMLPTRLGETRYVMQLAPREQNAAVWRSLPLLEGANRLTPRTGGLVETLAVSEEGIPLLLAHVVGSARVMAFAGDTTYLWYTSGHEAEHQRFWRQVILWLTRKELDTDQPVWVFAEPRNLAPGQRVSLTYGARDDKGKAVTDAAFDIEVLKPTAGIDRLAAPGGAERNSIEFAQTTEPGDYWVRAAATNDGRSLGLDGWTRFLVDQRDLELDNPAADPALLHELAELSGGSVVPPEQLASLLDRWLVEPPGKKRLTVFRRTPLWDNAFFIALFVALIGSEWYFRKRVGLV